jgi:hypothetical protein
VSPAVAAMVTMTMSATIGQRTPLRFAVPLFSVGISVFIRLCLYWDSIVFKEQPNFAQAFPTRVHIAFADFWYESMFYSQFIQPALNSVKDTAFILIYCPNPFHSCISKAFPLFKLPCHDIFFGIGEFNVHKFWDHQLGNFTENSLNSSKFLSGASQSKAFFARANSSEESDFMADLLILFVISIPSSCKQRKNHIPS